MAQAGIASRRDCETLIKARRVTVNGIVASLGDKADPARDTILVDGQPLQLKDEPVYIAVYKPRGVISTVDAPDLRPTVLDLVDVPERVYPVGRLDVDSEGLLTNDGELANRLTHPRYEHEKEYRVLVARRPDDEQLETWRRGVVLEDGYRTQPADVRIEEPFGKGCWLRVILKEGRKRQIRETGSRIGLPVVRIIRVRIGTLTLGTLKPREWRRLSSVEVADLKREPAARVRKATSLKTADKPAAGQGRVQTAARNAPRKGTVIDSMAPKARSIRPAGRAGTRADSDSWDRPTRPNDKSAPHTRTRFRRQDLPPPDRSGGKNRTEDSTDRTPAGHLPAAKPDRKPHRPAGSASNRHPERPARRKPRDDADSGSDASPKQKRPGSPGWRTRRGPGKPGSDRGKTGGPHRSRPPKKPAPHRKG